MEEFPRMNAKPAIREHLIALRMKHWLDIAQFPLMNTRVPTWRAEELLGAPEAVSGVGEAAWPDRGLGV